MQDLLAVQDLGHRILLEVKIPAGVPIHARVAGHDRVAVVIPNTMGVVYSLAVLRPVAAPL